MIAVNPLYTVVFGTNNKLQTIVLVLGHTKQIDPCVWLNLAFSMSLGEKLPENNAYNKYKQYKNKTKQKFSSDFFFKLLLLSIGLEQGSTNSLNVDRPLGQHMLNNST